MTTDVLIFGEVARKAGADRATVRVAEPPTVSRVLTALAEQHPALAFALPGARLAVNQRFVSPDSRVHPGDECALIALVGGG